jgi:hypothetical protein
MTRHQLRRIATRAMEQAVRAQCIREDKADDFGQVARHWQRLADAADALDAILAREQAYASAEQPPDVADL